MKQLLLITSLLCLLTLSLRLSAQYSGVIHLNQSFYVSGEIIWYKLYLPAGISWEHKVIAASLYDQSGVLVDRSFLRSGQESAVYGFYKIPYDCRTDIYRLSFTAAREEDNRPLLLAETFIPVYNDFEDWNGIVPTENAARPDEKKTSGPVNELAVEVQADRTSYPPRGNAALHITVKDHTGRPVPADWSISVTDQLLGQVAHPLFSTLQAGEIPEIPENLEADVNLRGRLYTPDGQSALPSGNIGAYLIDQKSFLYAKADENGLFTLDLPPVYGNCPMHIGGLLPEDLLVTFEQAPPSPSARQALPYPPEVVSYLEWSRRRKTIYQLYGGVENNLAASFPPTEVKPKKADWSLVLDEYDSFADIPTFLRELVVPIKFRARKDGIYFARMFDPTQYDRRFYSQGPLFILDGKLTRNADYIARLDINKIERIDLFYTINSARGTFGPLGRSGVMILQSRNRDLDVPPADQRNLFVIQGFQAEAEYPVKIQDAADSKTLLRPALYWAPNLTTNDQGKASLAIPLSDDRTVFRVEVVAQSPDGRRGWATCLFTVGE